MVWFAFWKTPMSVSSTSHSQELKSYQAILFLPPCSILYFWWIFIWYSRLQLECFPAKKDQQPIFHWGIWIQQIKIILMSYCSFYTFVKGSFCKTTRTIIIIFKNSLLMSMHGYFLIEYPCCYLFHFVGWNLSCLHGPFVSCIYFR